MSRPATTKRVSNGDANVIGASVRIRGRVTGDGDVRIEGHIEGDVRVTGALVLDASASVKGNASARTVDVEGTLRGDIAAEGAVAIKDGAHVEGNISGSEVALDEGASFVGRIDAEFELPDGLEGMSMAPNAIRGTPPTPGAVRRQRS